MEFIIIVGSVGSLCFLVGSICNIIDNIPRNKEELYTLRNNMKVFTGNQNGYLNRIEFLEQKLKKEKEYTFDLEIKYSNLLKEKETKNETTKTFDIKYDINC